MERLLISFKSERKIHEEFLCEDGNIVALGKMNSKSWKQLETTKQDALYLINVQDDVWMNYTLIYFSGLGGRYKLSRYIFDQ